MKVPVLIVTGCEVAQTTFFFLERKNDIAGLHLVAVAILLLILVIVDRLEEGNGK